MAPLATPKTVAMTTNRALEKSSSKVESENILRKNSEYFICISFPIHLQLAK